MEFDQNRAVQHTGVERYARSYDIHDTDDGRYDAKGWYVQFTIRPEILHLVWERRLGEDWILVESSGLGGARGGSCITGRRVLASGGLGTQEGKLPVVRGMYNSGTLSDYVKGIPELVALIKSVEAKLPE